MTFIKHQEGHLHIGLLLIAVAFVIGVLGFGVYSASPTSNKVLGAQSGDPDSPECYALDDLDPDVYDALPDQKLIDACGPDQCENGIIDRLVDRGTMTEAEYDAKCVDNDTNSGSGSNSNASIDNGGPADDSTDGTGSDPGSNSGVGANSLPGATAGQLAIILSSKNKCVSTLGQFELASIKKFGNSRIKARRAALNSLKKKYSSNKGISAKIKARQTKANNNLKAEARSAKYKLTKRDKINVSVTQKDPKQIKSDISKYKKKLDAYSKTLKASTTQTTAAETSCSVIFDLPVYSYLIPKMRAQDKIEAAKYKLAVAEIKAQASATMSRIHHTATASASKQAKLQQLKIKLKGIQARQDAITEQTVKNAQAANGRSYNIYTQTIIPGVSETRSSLLKL